MPKTLAEFVKEMDGQIDSWLVRVRELTKDLGESQKQVAELQTARKAIGPPAVVEPPRKPPTLVHKIRHFLACRFNSPAIIPEIAKGLGLKPSQIKAVLLGPHKHMFVSKYKPYSKQVAFSLSAIGMTDIEEGDPRAKVTA